MVTGEAYTTGYTVGEGVESYYFEVFNFTFLHPKHQTLTNTRSLQAAKAQTTPTRPLYGKPQKESREFDPSKYSTRFIALKLAYLGKNYNGYEYATGNKTPLPTIEEELWKALSKARLIIPRGDQSVGDWEGTEYSKCGRTDRGVSAFGQVVGVRVRSNRPLPKSPAVERSGEDLKHSEDDGHSTFPREHTFELASLPNGRTDNTAPSGTHPAPSSPTPTDISDPSLQPALNFDHINDELPYCTLLNRLLPPDIRILAWCPAPPIDFSARFSCRERQYRYFFTNPAFLPTPNHIDPFKGSGNEKKNMKDGWLDIEAMRNAAKSFEGVHDFRNFCKVDPSKQILNFSRRIFRATIDEVPSSSLPLSFLENSQFQLGEGNEKAKVYSFTLHGSAFLWHQVRCMVSILFLVGQGLETPSIVPQLLDVDTNPTRPLYEMACDTPLVLWDCVFSKEGDGDRQDALDWLYVGSTPGTGDQKFGIPTGGLMDELWSIYRQHKINELLAGQLFQKVAAQGNTVEELSVRGKKTMSQRVFDGSEKPKLVGSWTPVMRKKRGETIEVINERYAVRKGFEGTQEMRVLGFRRLGGRGEKEKEEEKNTAESMTNEVNGDKEA